MSNAMLIYLGKSTDLMNSPRYSLRSNPLNLKMLIDWNHIPKFLIGLD
jgi:hypothetical protein